MNRHHDAGASARRKANSLTARHRRDAAAAAAAVFTVFTLTALMAGPTWALIAATATAALTWAYTRPDTTPGQAAAGAWKAGAEGETATARALRVLDHDGWHILHDRALPGSRANLDHIAIPPSGGIIAVIDSKRWRRDWTTTSQGGNLRCGQRDHNADVASLIHEADAVARAFPAVSVIRIITVHGSIVRPGHLSLERTDDRGRRVTVHVVAAPFLVTALRSLHARTHRPPMPADRIADHAQRLFPPYTRAHPAA